MTEINGADYSVWHSPQNSTVVFQGSLSLGSTLDYTPIIQLLEAAIASVPSDRSADEVSPTLRLDLRKLEFLNSSGINMLSRFVIMMRQQPQIALVILGSKAVIWQGRSLKNLQRLMPTMQVEWA
ncbi:MAG: hypothetical protein D6742_13915 [Cyanobacteria bacterium J069]|nr:MAG: hypothetical protein D6742_13915 [Cyanobacteria bacterium J069]